MRAFISTLFLLALIMVSSAGQAVEPPFSITITGPKTAKAGQPIVIMINMRNTSDQPVNLRRHKGPEFEFAVAVLNSKGEPAQYTSRGHFIATRQCDWNDIEANGMRSCLFADYGHPIRVVLAPKAKRLEQIDVTRLFRMSEPGDYSIRISLSTADEPPTVVQSNTITVTVTP